MKLRSILSMCLVGTTLEWYDFALFGALAPVIAHLFFPPQDKLVGLIATFGIFAVGFIVRPIGAIALGHIGDKYGRKSTLSLSIIIMTIPTVLIGFLPTYESIGILAPVLLLILRLLQGFSVGGEYSGVITYLSEIAVEKQKGFYSSFSVFGVVGGLFLGTIIGALVSHIFSSKTLFLWGWRIPFIASIILGFIGYYLRKKAQETDEFVNLIKSKQIARKPFFNLLKKYKRETFAVMCIFWPIVLSTYLIFVYVPTKLVHLQNIPLSTILTINAVNMLVLVIFLPIFGKLSDKIGKELVIKLGNVLFIILSLPVFLSFSTSEVGFLIGQFIMAIMIAFLVAPAPAYIASLFPAKVRFTGTSLGLNLSAALFGGTAPLVAISIVHAFNLQIAPAIYLAISAIIGLIAICKWKVATPKS